ncbi:ABC transporter permease [Rubellimicrobium roseum]|uniref:Autoinducer 2 import system permease protein LsrD n=1 Tax=Rubellimicrobium roseum TaxID=687525 RepID=A0A5C4N7E7_9RHOB|nr:ABC transporter permease [Rubellimicrobium roseum]TNC63103.1 ABC transporter permease [Rubellimicrobium roseum]
MTSLPSPRRRLRIGPGTILLAALAVYVIAILWSGNTQFLRPGNILGMLTRAVALGITAVGQTIVILCASIDLSVAALISASAVLASVVMGGSTTMIVPAILAVLLLGMVVGLVNGLVITRLRVNPLIATLGMAMVIQGILSAVVSNFAGEVPRSFRSFDSGTVLGLPVSLIFLGLVAAGASAILNWTRFGSNIYAVGGNIDAARLAGIRTDRVIIAAHLLCSLCASVTGLYLAARLGSGAPWIGRDGMYDLESIAVAVIGGTVLAGGRGGIWGTMAGVAIFAMIDSLFNVLGVDAFAKQVLRGGIIVAAVAAYAIGSRRLVA